MTPDQYVRWEERNARRRARGVHRWDYEYPVNMWESWPWWLRWPVGFGLCALAVVLLILPLIHPLVGR